MRKLIDKTAEIAAQWWADRLMKGDKDKFKECLELHINKSLTETGHCYLENDYDPHGGLLDAVRAAGVECSGVFFSGRGILPQKHETTVTPGKIEPKEGYGNWTEAIEVKP
jgi:hypothetical protein